MNLMGLFYIRLQTLLSLLLKKDPGIMVERNEYIGAGFLGEEIFATIMNDVRSDNLPRILETPKELLLQTEIKKLYSFITE
jgi:deoxyribonuclease IV